MRRAGKTRGGLALALLGIGAWLALTGLAAASRGARPSLPLAHLASSGTWHGTAEGIDVDFGQLSSGDVQSTSEADYQVELSFSFSVSRSGDISGGGSGYYTDANWHLYGVNGDNGSFDCYPPIVARSFHVDVNGHASGHRATVSLSMPDASETNDDYDCGADYTGYATTTHEMADSLKLVGGDHLDISLRQPTSLHEQKTTSTGGGSDDTENDQHIWAFSFAPPDQSSTDGGGGGGSGGRGSACNVSLSHVVAKPSRTTGGEPVVVRFRVSHTARASLLVSPPTGAASTVAALDVPAGRNTLVWGGWIGNRPATAGSYKMTVVAAACGTTHRRAVSVTIS